MEEFKKELKELLDQYNADIIVETDIDRFSKLRIVVDGEKSDIIDSGYAGLKLKLKL